MSQIRTRVTRELVIASIEPRDVVVAMTNENDGTLDGTTILNLRRRLRINEFLLAHTWNATPRPGSPMHIAAQMARALLLNGEPITLRVADVQIRDGHRVSVCEAKVQLESENTHGFDLPQDVFLDYLFAPWGDRVSFEKLLTLNPGDVAARAIAHALHRTPDGGLTDKHRHFPPNRPQGHEWTKFDPDIRFAQRVKAQDWPVLLDALEGCFFSDLVRTQEGTKKLLRDHRVIEEYAAQVQRVGACFDASAFDGKHDVTVRAGKKLLFHGFKNGREFWIVDVPRHGHGCYVYTNEASALDWAENRVQFQEARRQAHAFIAHTDGWQDRLAQALTAP